VFKEDRQIRVILYLLVSVIVVLIGQPGRELLPPDDLREAEVAREMYTSGDYIVPHLAGLPFVEKPPGFPAIVATAYSVFGRPSADVARYITATFALMSLAAVFLLGRLVLGIEGGALAAALLALSIRFCRTAHFVLLDNALTAAVAFTVLFAWIALEADNPRRKCLFYSAAGFSLGMSFLFKGFLGPIIFGSGFVMYLIFSKRFNEFRHILLPLPVIAFFIPVLSWLVPFFMHTPAPLIREFFVENHFSRFMSGYQSNHRPVYFYLRTIWLNFMPGGIILPYAIWLAWKTRGKGENRAAIFFLSLIIGPFVVLSASVAKDSVYLLPVYPSLALLVAWSIVKGWTSPGQKGKILIQGMSALIILAAGFMVVGTYIHGGSAYSLALATVVFVPTTVACIFSLIRADLRWTIVFLAVLFALGWGLWYTGPMARADMARCSIYRPMIETIHYSENRDILLYSCDMDDGIRGAMGFYRNKTAQEIRSPEVLVARLSEHPDKTVALISCFSLDALPQELDKAARGFNTNLIIQTHINYRDRYILLVNAVPKSPKMTRGNIGLTQTEHHVPKRTF
jgi:4-amino-4-deoxy-L-arabinose transferase-like glycosyltransferase